MHNVTQHESYMKRDAADFISASKLLLVCSDMTLYMLFCQTCLLFIERASCRNVLHVAPVHLKSMTTSAFDAARAVLKMWPDPRTLAGIEMGRNFAKLIFRYAKALQAIHNYICKFVSFQ